VNTQTKQIQEQETGTGGDIPVWDLMVRVGHWTLVVAFTVAWLSSEQESAIHIWSGYLVATIVALRLVWGLVGSHYARFGSFVRGPRTVIDYLRGLVSGTAPRFLGHNPAGGAMTIALLAALALTTISGMAVYAVEENAGPLAGFVAISAPPARVPAIISAARASEDGEEGGYGEGREEFWEEVHEASANATLALVIVHILGVLVSSIAHRENLPRAMITGRKRQAP
jgi:cytochrome b